MKKLFGTVFLAATLIGGLCSCGQTSKEPSPLIAQSERVSGELGDLAEESPMYLQSADADYADGVMSIGITFSDPSLNVASVSDALVQYVLAQYMKNHTGKNLDEILNTLNKEEGSMKITLTGADGQSKEFTIPAARAVRLVKLKPSELNFNEVKENVVEILASRCEELKEKYSAENVEFEIASSFAQYTFTFKRPTAYASLTQASLRGRYLKVLQEQYENYGACSYMIQDFLKSLKIDGYRYIYTSNGNELSAAVPWSML